MKTDETHTIIKAFETEMGIKLDHYPKIRKPKEVGEFLGELAREAWKLHTELSELQDQESGYDISYA